MPYGVIETKNPSFLPHGRHIEHSIKFHYKNRLSIDELCQMELYSNDQVESPQLPNQLPVIYNHTPIVPGKESDS